MPDILYCLSIGGDTYDGKLWTHVRIFISLMMRSKLHAQSRTCLFLYVALRVNRCKAICRRARSYFLFHLLLSLFTAFCICSSLHTHFVSFQCSALFASHFFSSGHTLYCFLSSVCVDSWRTTTVFSSMHQHKCHSYWSRVLMYCWCIIYWMLHDCVIIKDVVLTLTCQLFFIFRR
jgi:hypothetical protein